MVMNKDQINDFIQEIPEEVFSNLTFSMSVPWQMDPDSDSDYTDADGAPILSKSEKSDDSFTRSKLQSECWQKFHKNPYINTSVRGTQGRLTGLGFEVSSGEEIIQDLIEEIEEDWRNRLYNFWPKYAGRSLVEGELYLILTCHDDGFIEVDFLDPASLAENGDDSTGIIYHSRKTTFPLFYNIKLKDDSFDYDQIPSIFIAKFPDLIRDADQHNDFKVKNQQNSKNRKKKFRKFGGFYRFVVGWDKGFVTRRAISYLRTTLEWLNHYENLKKYEIDHKRSSGAYLWTVNIEDAKTFKLWLSLSDDDRRKTGLMAKKTPGSTLILPPGMKLEVANPKLNSITSQDEDIKELIASGVNEPTDVMASTTRGSSFASLNASRGPMSDRTSDEIAYFGRFLRFDFWGAVFFLRSELTDFPKTFKKKIAVSFGKDKKPIFKDKDVRPEKLIDFNWPTSEIVDYESRATAFLGSKHGPMAETLGIPNEEISRKMGFGSYERMRLRQATEKELYPDLIYNMDAESLQEKKEGNLSESRKNAKTK